MFFHPASAPPPDGGRRRTARMLMRITRTAAISRRAERRKEWIMGKRGRDVVDLNIEELIQKLNRALAEEWLAFYQYWVGARLMEGPMRSEIEPELLVHADEELNHAVMLIDRIIQLGGTPVLTPTDWMELSECEYGKPEDPYVEVILRQNLDAERCAIERYNELANFTDGKDHATRQTVTTILNQELEHEQEISDWMDDLARMREDIRRLH
jgi:bacterioferritin